MKYKNILETVGNTPLVQINRLFPKANKKNITVLAKLERANPGGSIKDRIAKKMIEDAIEAGLVKEGTVIIEPTSGNTGVGLAMACAVLGYRLIITMPESMSLERRRLMALYGAELVLTPKEKGMKGAIEKAQEIADKEANSWVPMQFDNPSNVAIHREQTAQEILSDVDGKIDYLITGVGTGGHITGVSEVLKEEFNELKVYAVEPSDSPVLSGGDPGPHPIQGIGAGFVPKVLNREILDGVVTITKDEAFDFAQRAAKEEGILLGISSGASLAAIEKSLDEMPEGSTVVTFCYDTGERYLTTEGLF